MDTLDQLFTVAFRKLLNALCFITGKSNFFLAKAAMVASIVFCAAYAVLGKDWLSGFVAAIWIVCLPRQFHNIDEIERETKKRTDILALSSLDRERWQWFRVLLVVTTMLEIGLSITEAPRTFRCGFLLSVAASEYFRYENNSGGKHVIRRSVDWVKAQAPSFNPLPAPRPELA